MDSAQPTISRRSWLLAWAVLALAVLATYRQAFDVFFLNEDFTWLWRCRIGSWRDLWPIVTYDVMGGTYSWRPLVQLSFALNELANGLHPASYRAEALAWNILAAGLVLRIGQRLGGLAVGVVAAAVFVLHPLQVESVAWTCARGGPMSTAFVAAAVLAHLKWREGRASMLATGILFALGLATQESAVLLLPILLAADVLLPGRTDWRRSIPLYLGLATIVLIGSVWRAFNSQASIDLPLAPGLPLDLSARVNMGLAKFSAVVASTLTFSRAALVVFALLGGWAIRRWWAGYGLALWGLVWMMVAIGPYLTFLLGPFPRHLHLALVGFGLLVGDLTVSVWQTSTGRRRLAVAAVLLIATMAWGWRMHGLIDRELVAYRWRGEMTERFLSETKQAVPQATPGSTFAFYRVGELRARDGVFVFGLEDALRLLYEDGTLRVVFPELGKGVGIDYHLAYVDGRLWRLAAP